MSAVLFTIIITFFTAPFFSPFSLALAQDQEKIQEEPEERLMLTEEETYFFGEEEKLYTATRYIRRLQTFSDDLSIGLKGYFDQFRQPQQWELFPWRSEHRCTTCWMRNMATLP